MSKKKNKKEEGNIYYVTLKDSRTLRKIVAVSDEEAIKKADEMFGENNYEIGHLKHALTKTEYRETKRISEKVAGEMMGPVGKAAMKVMNDMDRIIPGSKYF